MSRARTSRAVPLMGGERRLMGAMAHLASLPVAWIWRVRCRRELAMLSPEQLRDVGLDPEAVRRERRKPFWLA